MIFLSHNHKDKVLVEQFALRLREIFGQENVFYDSWAIQPGDGIIDKMNAGLEACRLFLFFVSKNSLQSNMVKLEWQSAILKAANGQARLVPIKPLRRPIRARLGGGSPSGCRCIAGSKYFRTWSARILKPPCLYVPGRRGDTRRVSCRALLGVDIEFPFPGTEPSGRGRLSVPLGKCVQQRLSG